MVVDFDLVKMKKEDVEFANKYEIVFAKDEKVHALVAYFDVGFTNLENSVWLSTSPYVEYTHWK